MRCQYCGTQNEEGVESCRECGEQLSHLRSQWRGPEVAPSKSTPTQVSTAHDEWDPARRFAEPRSTSTFVPPTRYATHLSWIITIIFLGIPATAIHALLLSRGAHYPHNLEVAVFFIMACCLPLSMVALLFSGLIGAKHRSGDDARAYRYSRTTGLLCWISLIAALALYVILFLRMMSSVGEFWTA